MPDAQELLVAYRGALLAEHAQVEPGGIGRAEFGADGEALHLVADSVGGPVIPMS
jgi:hypothetical protein